MKKNSKITITDPFQKWAHSYGRFGTFIALVYMILLPIIVCVVYDCMPALSDVFNFATFSILLIYIPVGISEALSYIPVLGSSSYLTFITGNIMNLKFPCAVNAMKVADVEQNTPEGDAIATIGVAASSLMTLVILAIAALLSQWIAPVFENPSIATASQYIIPALFGSMALGLFTSTGNGSKVVKKGFMGVLPVIIIVVAISIFFRAIGQGSALMGLVGVFIVFMLPVSIISSRIMWKKGIITVEDQLNNTTSKEE